MDRNRIASRCSSCSAFFTRSSCAIKDCVVGPFWQETKTQAMHRQISIFTVFLFGLQECLMDCKWASN